jgi:hypothetical protein
MQAHGGRYFGAFPCRFACETVVRCDPERNSGRGSRVRFREKPVHASAGSSVSER